MYKIVSMRFLQFIILLLIVGCTPLETTSDDEIIAPSVFTPNGDGRNDVFEVISKNGNKVALKIYTRAGVLVFSIEAERCRWDGYSLSGQEMATGIYYFTAETIEIYDSSAKVAKNGYFYLQR